MNEIRPVNWSFALLKQNPFPDTPPHRTEDAVWAGMPRLRSQIEALFIEALTTSATQVVLNRGAFGSGKTHAAVFFGSRDRLPQVVSAHQVKDTLILYVRNPKEGSNASEILYQDIIEAIRFGRLRRTIKELIAERGKQGALQILQDVSQSEALGQAIWLLGLEERGYRQLELFNEETESPEWRRMLEAYFFSQVTKGDLKELGLSRGIGSSQDRFRVLSAILHGFIGFSSAGELTNHQRVILWIDEMEDLIYFTSRQHRPFTQGLRELIDRLPYYFTLFMNFTLTSPEEWEDINVTLGGAVMDRVTHHVYFQEPNQDEALEYVCELMQKFRTKDPESLGLPLTYPFTEDTLQMAISTLPSCTPRDLNQRCSAIVTKALQRGVITAAGEGMVTADFIASLDSEQIDFDLG